MLKTPPESVVLLLLLVVVVSCSSLVCVYSPFLPCSVTRPLTTAAAMSTVGFLSLLSDSELQTLQAPKESDLPPYLRQGATTQMSAAEVLKAPAATPRELDEYKRWLEEVVKAPPRLVEREARAKSTSARQLVFLAFYRMGIPVRSIKASNIASASSWDEQGRTAWPNAQWIEVPSVRSTASMATTYSYNWWLNGKSGPLPASSEMVRMPKIVVCHRLQTSVHEDDTKAQGVRFRDDRQAQIDAFLGRSTESESSRALKEQHSEWQANAVGSFMSKMNIDGSAPAEAQHGISLLEGYLDMKRSFGWKKRWYVLTGGNGIPGMLRYDSLVTTTTAAAVASSTCSFVTLFWLHNLSMSLARSLEWAAIVAQWFMH
jgi:hypothetical protein